MKSTPDRGNGPRQRRGRFAGIGALAFAAAVAAFAAASALADMPNRALTPGEIAQRDAGAVCRAGNARRHRAVPYRIRDRVYLEYGVARGHRQGRYKIDHLIPLELGGSNGMRNLWPQPTVDAALKDQVESELHAAVCNGGMPLERAQRAIARDWHTAVRLP
ncbi:MAG: HNH endonuclease [Candidatus Eremiobacteraeota bacterium]|nr:HNH endonuclease [Candidatus Eremiobacteraeota bacterium]